MSFDSIVLTVYDSAGTVYGVTWQTKKEGKPFLEYTSEDDVSFSHSVKVAAAMSPSTGTVKNCAEIRGLRPGEKCRYRVGDEKHGVSDDAVFTAFSQNPDKSDFIVMADTQCSHMDSSYLNYVSRDILARYPQSEFWINAGDFVEHSRKPEYWKAFFDSQSKFVRTKPLLPVAGNHEYCYSYTRDYFYTLYSHFNLDVPPQDTRYGMYYSFDNGPVHVVVLNTGDWEVTFDGHVKSQVGGLLDSQIEWLKKDLVETDKEWKIVVLHNPLYSPGKYGSDIDDGFNALVLREQLNALLAERRVDLVINGHDHIYDESYPIAADGSLLTDTEYEKGNVEDIIGDFAVNPRGPIHFQPFEAGGRVGDSISDKPFFRNPFRVIFDKLFDISGYAHVTAEHGKLSVRTRILGENGLVTEYAFGIIKRR